MKKQRRKTGPKPLPPGKVRTCCVTMRLTPVERDRLRAAVKAAGVSTSEYLRELCRRADGRGGG